MITEFVKITRQGSFALGGKPFLVHCAVYYGRYPGTCGGNWLADPYWARNRQDLKRDFSLMQSLNINTAGVFVRAEDLIRNGRPIESRMKRLDTVVNAAEAHNVRLIIFPGPFVDNPKTYKLMTGQDAPVIECWHATWSTAVFDAYVHIMALLAERYRQNPHVLGYMDRIDRFVPSFGRRDKIPGLERIWRRWLEQRYGSFDKFLGSHPNLTEKPREFSQVKMPQDFPDGFSMRDSRAYEYALMQRTLVGDAQHRFDREMKKLAPDQIMWTPFEGVNIANPILDGAIPTPKVLEALWVEYYDFTGFTNVVRVPAKGSDTAFLLLQPRPVVDIPDYSAQAYMVARWLKQATQVPVILCTGSRMQSDRKDNRFESHHRMLVDRTNRACLEAGADGWAYWCWSDDATSLTATAKERESRRSQWQLGGETMGLIRWDGTLRPAALTARAWGRQMQAGTRPHAALARDVLLLLPEPKMMIEQETLAVQSATAACGALLRAGALPQVQWSANTRQTIPLDNITAYKLVMLGDSTYQRDHRDIPDKLLKYVAGGGVLLWPVHSTEWLEDEFGNRQPQPALAGLAGCGKPPSKIEGVGTVEWFIEPEFEQQFSFLNGDHSCCIECDHFTWLAPDAATTEVIASAKFQGGNAPLFYRHRIGKGVVYVFTWSFNVFRDDVSDFLYGGDEMDWLLALPLESAGVIPDLRLGLGAALRDQAFVRPTQYRRMRS